MVNGCGCINSNVSIVHSVSRLNAATFCTLQILRRISANLVDASIESFVCWWSHFWRESRSRLRLAAMSWEPCFVRERQSGSKKIIACSKTYSTFVSRILLIGTRTSFITATTVGVNPNVLFETPSVETDWATFRNPQSPSGNTIRSLYFSGVWNASAKTKLENAVWMKSRFWSSGIKWLNTWK